MRLWPRRTRPAPSPTQPHVDLDRVSIPLDDPTDPTSVLLSLSMRIGSGVLLTEDKGLHAVEFTHAGQDRQFVAPSQLGALRQAVDWLDMAETGRWHPPTDPEADPARRTR